MIDPFLLYFGCWDEPGHFIFDRNHRSVRDAALPTLALRAEVLDGSHIFLPWPEAPGFGQITRLIRNDECITVLAWWDRTFDKRGKCNAAIQCNGWEDGSYLWERFSRVYELLAKQLIIPKFVNNNRNENQ